MWGTTRKYGVSEDELKALNPILNTGFPAGAVIKIPVLETEMIVAKPVNDAAFSKHHVEKGETLYGLSKKYDLSIVEIKKYNPVLEKRNLVNGETILIPEKPDAVFEQIVSNNKVDSVKLVEALRETGLKATFIATGQTGILQGAAYGVAVDVLSSGFATGEVENAIINAYEKENPDIIIVEGQGALSHPAFTSSSAIIRGSMPDAIILQHPPKRDNHCDYPAIPMPTLESEIELIEVFSQSKVMAITINHEDMTDDEVNNTIVAYEYKYELPVTDVLKYGSKKLVQTILDQFPELQKRASLLWQVQE